MREILFRGKKETITENNKDYLYDGWVYGNSLYQDDNGVWILPDGVSAESRYIRPYDFRANSDCIEIMCAKVIPETVGQFTGLTDKNGKKIFEGDILKSTEGILQEVIYHNFPLSKESLNACFGCKTLFDDNTFTVYGICLSDEVVGNVFDNKDLIKSYSKKEIDDLAEKARERDLANG